MKKILLSALCLASISFTAVHASSIGISSEINSRNHKSTSNIQSNWDDAVVTDAMSNFKSLSRVERKARVKEVKKYLKEYKENAANATGSNDKVLLAILAILLPPLSVYLHEGTTNNTFWISVVLTLLFWIPGVIFALITVL
ncbi:YqaE/Pmp3 family membrane protein [Sediminibacterium sp. TEGAF015]|uniref:YqaE/Pmp3 family membrane protein n=1 Tax=Sediminibacterium sp. TEGAF015 TaxID=575378 RepID=UPI00220AF458|nr:YqaE/Pmp3 family membrane protein [Sediminibacterium sp. TEGAF015]BDQ11356.1 hypothetical protein TEGAF0_05730 [Sediminibacterium sp. TEGAF015]